MKTLMLLAIASTLTLASCSSNKIDSNEAQLQDIVESSQSSTTAIGEEAEFGSPERLDNTNRSTTKNQLMNDKTKK
jgi:protein involved in sex pheromone biosynthesis